MSTAKFDALCIEAKQAIAARDWERARDIYEKALALSPAEPDVHHGLATVYFQLRDLPSAAKHFKEVTILDPLRPGVFINLGAIYNLLDRLDEAITVLRRGIQLDPKRAEGYYNLGLAYRRSKQNDLAIEAYREAIRVNSNLADAHYNLGNIYLEREQYKLAYQCYQSALKARPGWEKAEMALEQAGEGLALEEQEERPRRTSASLSAEEIALAAPRLNVDPEKMIHPDLHGEILDALHTTTKNSEKHGQRFQELLLKVVEPAVKDLSAALLYSQGSASALSRSLEKFDQALAQVRQIHDKLHDSVFQVGLLSAKLAE